MRARVSGEDPGGKGTTMWMGREGQSAACDHAGTATSAGARPRAERVRRRRRPERGAMINLLVIDRNLGFRAGNRAKAERPPLNAGAVLQTIPDTQRRLWAIPRPESCIVTAQPVHSA